MLLFAFSTLARARKLEELVKRIVSVPVINYQVHFWSVFFPLRAVVRL
jgi:hypothetical protein